MILWLLKRKLRRQVDPAVEAEISFDLEDHFANRLAFGMMRACYFSAKAAQEARGGPSAVLRNTKGDPITVRVEAPYIAPH